jgi:hypothetical protein
LSSSDSRSPLRYLVWVFALFAVYELSFLFDGGELSNMGSMPVDPVVRIREKDESNKNNFHPPEKFPIFTAGSTRPTFDRLGHVSKAMPQDGLICWLNGEGEKASCWLSRGQVMTCPPLTGGNEVKLQVSDVREVERGGGYDYELLLIEIDSGRQHILPLRRLDRSVRLY